MDIRTFAEVTTPDDRSLSFTPLGLALGGRLSPEDAAAFQQRSIAAADLVLAVPEDTRSSFERLRTMHASRTRLSQSLLLFTPEMVLRWHRELVRRKWTFPHRRAAERPRIAVELEALIMRLARENPRWGYSKIEGELRKLGYRVGRSTIRAVLKHQHLLASPARTRQNSTWRAFLRQHQQHLLACDFFTVETLRLQTLYIVFFIEVGTRCVHVAGCTAKLTAQWVYAAGTPVRVEAAGARACHAFSRT